MKIKQLERVAEIENVRGGDNDEDRLIEISFSSEVEVERYFGVEILDHSAASVNLERLNKRAAVLVNHDYDDQVGVVESASIGADRKGRATIRFGKSERASEIWQDVKDGIRSLVSVGYRIHEMVREKSRDDGVDVYRITNWEPSELSIVAVPADVSVGIGRTSDSKPENQVRVIDMTEKKTEQETATKTSPAPKVDFDADRERQEIRRQEQDRSNQIRAIGKQFNVADLADKHIESGKTVDQMRDAVLEHIGKNPTPAAPAEIDLDHKEVKRYSLMNAINAYRSGNWKKAGFELECSRGLSDVYGKDPQGFFVPSAILARTLDSATATAAAELVGTDHRADMFIELLRPRSVVVEAGATLMDGLVGNVDIPKQTGGASFQWLAEDGDITSTDQATGVLALSPKTIGGGTEMTRRLLLQSSPSVDNMVVNDLLRGLALAVDLAALAGTGAANQPTGILNTAGVGSVTLAAGAVTRENIVDLETAVATANADLGALRYVFNAAEAGIMKKTRTDAGSGQFLLDGDTLNGYAYSRSNQLANDKIIFGNFNDIVMGFWSGIDLKPDEAAKAASGGLVLRVFQDLDIGVRHAESFAVGATI